VPLQPPFPRPYLPVVLFVHGGAWQRGDKRWGLNLYWNVGVAAARAGAVGVTINYRLSPEVRHPTHLDDVRSAWAWVRGNIHRYGGDAARVILAGHSAGAHLAALAACTPAPPAAGLAGLLGLSGVYDLARIGASAVGPSITEPAFGTAPANLELASPAHQLEHATSGQALAAAASNSDVSLPAVLQPVATAPVAAGGASRSPWSWPQVVLLTAEADFHLHEDAADLHAAVLRSRSAVAPSLPLERHAVTVDPLPPTVEGVGWADDGGGGVWRGVVAGTNHMTVVGGVGQVGDPVTAVLRAMVRQVGKG